MELGLGIHGEPGASKVPLQPVDAIVSQVHSHRSVPSGILCIVNIHGCPLEIPKHDEQIHHACFLQVLDRVTSKETGYLHVQPGDSVALLVNSLGTTSPMELSIVARTAITQLTDKFKVLAYFSVQQVLSA